MKENTISTLERQFQEEIYLGLTDFPKHLSSKYFYDEKGDLLFQEITNMPEYYLTKCEFQILESYKEELIKHFTNDVEKFNLIELGAGDGKKTKILLKHFVRQGVSFKYLPIDISRHALEELEATIKSEIPEVPVTTLQGTYFEVLENLYDIQGGRKVILFLGSNIGNFQHPEAIQFLRKIQNLMAEDDLFFVGFDKKKHPRTILNAYSDSAGITAAFNKNILTRINSELNGNFDLDKFMHWESYDPETGTAKSYLVSKETQRVSIKDLNLVVDFNAWETIHTEISQKYDDKMVSWLAEEAGLEIDRSYSDSRNNFTNYLFKKII